MERFIPLAAQSLAMQGMEQARCGKMATRFKAWPAVDDLGVTNYTEIDTLDVPFVSHGHAVLRHQLSSASARSPADPPVRR